MRYLIGALIQLTSIYSQSQSLPETKSDSINILSTRWRYIKTILNGIDQDSSDSKNFFIISKDGRYELTKDNERLLDGKWELDTQRNTFTTNDKQAIRKWVILKLSNDEFKLEIEYDGDKILMIFMK